MRTLHVNTWSVYSWMCVLILELRCCCRHCVRWEHLAASVHERREGEGGHAHLSAVRNQPQPVDPDRSCALPQTAVSGTTWQWRLEAVTVVQTAESQQEENTNVTNYQVWYWLIFSNYDPKVETKPRSWRYSDCLLWTVTPTRMKRLYSFMDQAAALSSLMRYRADIIWKNFDTVLIINLHGSWNLFWIHWISSCIHLDESPKKCWKREACEKKSLEMIEQTFCLSHFTLFCKLIQVATV